MAVIIENNTKILIQGFTGKMGTFHAEEMIKYGSNVVGGVTPGKGGQKHLDKPVFNTVKDAVKNTGATASILFVPPAFAADSAMEAAEQMKNLGIGISTSVGIGGDPINGSSFRDIIEKFETDDETDAILMIGEIGGPQEVAAGEFAKENMKKPVIGYIAGLTAPKGRVMGHAGAIVSAYGESAVEKVELLKECGVTISKNPSVMGETVKSVLAKL